MKSFGPKKILKYSSCCFSALLWVFPSFHLQHFQTDPLASKLYDDCVAVDWRLCTPDFQLQSALKRSSLDDRISLFSVLCSVWFEGVQTYISVSKRTTRQKEIILWRPLESLQMYNVCKKSPQDASVRPTRYTPHVFTEVALTTSSRFFSSFYHGWNIVNVKSWCWKGWSKKKKGLVRWRTRTRTNCWDQSEWPSCKSSTLCDEWTLQSMFPACGMRSSNVPVWHSQWPFVHAALASSLASCRCSWPVVMQGSADWMDKLWLTPRWVHSADFFEVFINMAHQSCLPY